MNREFISKMMQAKKLEYEALKSIMPEKMEARIQKVEEEVLSCIKEYALSQWMGDSKDSDDEQNSDVKKKVHKVNIQS